MFLTDYYEEHNINGHQQTIRKAYTSTIKVASYINEAIELRHGNPPDFNLKLISYDNIAKKLGTSSRSISEALQYYYE